MAFHQHEKWIHSLTVVPAVCLVQPLFSAAGLPSPIESNSIWGIVLFVVTGWGIKFLLTLCIELGFKIFAPNYGNQTEENLNEDSKPDTKTDTKAETKPNK
jgi:hypothetical protein